MGSQWTDKSAIMRDLSFAQGRWVPGGIDTAVASGKPPTNNVTEETEEEYFRRWTADGDFNACPDLSLISEMLDMVQDDVADSQDVRTGPIEIKKKLNPITKVFVPKFKKSENKEVLQNSKVNAVPEKTDRKKRPLRERNVAIASIIANYTKMSQDLREEPIKLSKPEDFIKTSTSTKNIDKEEVDAIRKNDSVNKVNSWLQSQDTCSMFKTKSTDSVKSPLQSDQSLKPPQKSGQQYVPSSWADEYYKKCMDRTHIRDMVQENVWLKAEKLMQEIDLRKAEEQRKQEEEDAALAAALAAAEQDTLPNETADHCESKDKPDTSKEPPVADLQGIASIFLPQHRHLLTGDCVVCKVLSQPTEKEVYETKPEDVETIKPEVQDGDENGNQEEDLFCLVRSGFVENLADSEAVEQNCVLLEESDSTEILDISTSDS